MPCFDIGYQIVSQTFTESTDGNGDGPGGYYATSVAAPSGYKVVGGGFTLGSGINSGNHWQMAIAMTSSLTVTEINNHEELGSTELYSNGPASDGSAWNFAAVLVPSTNQSLTAVSPSTEHVTDGSAPQPPSGAALLTVYAICLAV